MTNGRNFLLEAVASLEADERRCRHVTIIKQMLIWNALVLNGLLDSGADKIVALSPSGCQNAHTLLLVPRSTSLLKVPRLKMIDFSR